MYALATCTASVLRGTSTNQYGDLQDNGTVVATGLLASIQEADRTVWDPATQTPRIVRKIWAAMQSDAPIQSGDQLRDDTHGITYMVNSVTQPGGPGWTSDLEIDLRRITPAA
jgi:hypothetical protein